GRPALRNPGRDRRLEIEIEDVVAIFDVASQARSFWTAEGFRDEALRLDVIVFAWLELRNDDVVLPRRCTSVIAPRQFVPSLGVRLRSRADCPSQFGLFLFPVGGNEGDPGVGEGLTLESDFARHRDELGNGFLD